MLLFCFWFCVAAFWVGFECLWRVWFGLTRLLLCSRCVGMVGLCYLFSLLCSIVITLYLMFWVCCFAVGWVYIVFYGSFSGGLLGWCFVMLLVLVDC